MWLLDQGNDDCYCDCCTHCKYIKEIRLELFKNSFQTFNKSVSWWRIHEKWEYINCWARTWWQYWWWLDWQLDNFFFLVQNPVAKKLEKANMMVLSKEMTDKDRSLKTQLLIKSNSDVDERLSGEKVWKNNGFLKMLNHNWI